MFGNGRFVGLSWGGLAMSTSVDGSSWSTVMLPELPGGSWDYQYADLAYGNGIFVAAGGTPNEWNTSLAGAIAVSTNGSDWTFPEVPRPGFRWFQSIGFGNGVFVAAGNVAYSSIDGLNWIPNASSFNVSPGGIAYGNSSFLAFAFASKETRQSNPFIDLRMNPNGNLNLRGPRGRSVQLEMSTNLSGGIWESIGQVNLQSENTNVVTGAPLHGSRFYRAVLSE